MSDPETAGAITARGLMKADFRTIGSNVPLREALRILTGCGDEQGPTPLVVTAPDGSFAGVLTPLALYLALLKGIHIDDLGSIGEPDLLEAVRPELDQPVSAVMVTDVPLVRPEDRLFLLMKSATRYRVEYSLVLVQKRVVGVIFVTDIFRAAASLALAHESKGISLPGGDEKLGH